MDGNEVFMGIKKKSWGWGRGECGRRFEVFVKMQKKIGGGGGGGVWVGGSGLWGGGGSGG